MSVSQDRNQENRFRPFSTTLFLCDLDERVTIELLKVKSWRISNIVSRQVKINKVRFFFPDKMPLNPLLHDNVHAKDGTGSKTARVNSSEKHVNKDYENPELKVCDSDCCYFERHPTEDTTAYWPYSNTLLQVMDECKMSDYMDFWCGHFWYLYMNF